MQLQMRKKKAAKEEFSLVEEVGKFIKDHNIDASDMEKSLV